MVDNETQEILRSNNYLLFLGSELDRLFIEDSPIVENLITLYQNVFGHHPWNEWATKTNSDGSLSTIGLDEFSTLDERQKLEFSPYYPAEELRARFVTELTGEEHNPFLLIRMDEASNSIVSATYGSKSSQANLIARIGHANYAGDNSWENHAQTIARGLSQKLGDLEPLYIDETLIRPDRQGVKADTFKHFEALYQVIGRVYRQEGIGTPIFYRTLRNSNMGKITRKYIRTGLVEEIHSHPIADNEIIFLAGTIPDQLITYLLQKPDIFSSLFQS
jgi:hypothetical protein